MLRVGIAGIGFMGWIHWLAYKNVPGVEVVAVCERDEKRLAGDWTGIQGNFGPPGEHVDLSGIKTYFDLNEMVADESIDYIDICLPPSLHLMAIKAAAAAGKNVFSEKPLALSLDEADAAVAACNAAQVQLLVGHVLPFFPEYQIARDEIGSGKYGKLLGGHFKRIISDPLWLKDFYDPQRVGGPLLDLHIHDAHLIRLLFGMPTEICSSGRTRGEVVSFCSSIFRFADPDLVVSSSSGVIEQQGRPFTHGFEIYLEKATLQFEFAALEDGTDAIEFKIMTPDGKVTRPEITDGDPLAGFTAELQEVVHSLSKGQPSPILSGDLARDAIQLCHAQSESVFNRTTVALNSA